MMWGVELTTKEGVLTFVTLELHRTPKLCTLGASDNVILQF